MKSIKQIKLDFPNPTKVIEGDEEEEDKNYCVGGAICMSEKEQTRFPNFVCLAETLTKRNSNLSLHAAKLFAARIIWFNDRERF